MDFYLHFKKLEMESLAFETSMKCMTLNKIKKKKKSIVRKMRI